MHQKLVWVDVARCTLRAQITEIDFHNCVHTIFYSSLAGIFDTVRFTLRNGALTPQVVSQIGQISPCYR